MRGSRAGFEPKVRSTRARVKFGLGGAGAMRLPNLRAEIAFGLGGSGSLATFQGVSFGLGGGGAFQQRALVQFGLGGAGFLAVDEAEPTYANGFKHFLEFLIPAENVFGTGALNNYLGSIDDTFPELRTVANGGLVEHASGFDMQAELADGTVIPFARPLWEATTGRIVARPRWATMPVAGSRYRLFFGKTVSVDGANEGSAYAAHLMAPNIRTGADRTGLGRNFTPTAITAGTLAGFAATFNGSTSQLVRTNPTELNGLSAITIQALVQLSSTTGDKPIFIAGPNSGADFGLHLRFRVSDGRLVFTIRVGTTSIAVESVDGVMPAVDEPILVAARWSSGQAPTLYAGGQLLDLAVPGTALTGTVNATLGAASSEALIGYNRLVGTRWAGQIADLMVSARVLSVSHLQTQERNYLTPRDCYGAGEANSASQTNLSPVLPPIFQAATVGQDAEADPALAAYEADPGQVKTLESHVGAAGGTFSIVGGRSRFRPSSAGLWPSTAVVRDNGSPPKRSTGRIIWNAAEASGLPKHPPTVPDSRIFTVGYTGPGGSGNQYDSLEAAFGAIPGEGGYRVRLNDVAVAKTAGWSLAREFGQHVVIESRNPLGATLNGRIYAHQGRKLWLYQLDTTAPTSQLGNTTNASERGSIVINSDVTITRCRIRAVNGICVIDNPNADDQGVGAFQAARRFYIGWNAFVGRNPDGIRSPFHLKLRLKDGSNPPAGAAEFDDFSIYNNYFYDPDTGNDKTTVRETFNVYIGNSHVYSPDYFCSANGIIEGNLFAAGNNRRCIYLKRAVTKVRRNHAAGYKNEPFTQRHGWGCEWRENRCSQGGGNMLIGGGRLPGYSTGATQVIGNVITGGLQLKAGTSNGSTDEQAANYALVVGNQCGGVTVIGHRRNDNFKIAADAGGKLGNIKFYQHTGDVAAIDEALVDKASCDIRAGYTGHGMSWGVAPVLSAAVVGLETAAQ